MLKSRLSATTCAVGAVAIILAGCSQSSAQQARAQAPSDVVATVGSTSITLAQVDGRALQQSTASFGGMRLSQALYEARRLAINELVEEALLDQTAASRRMDKAQIIEQEITSKVVPPSDDEVTAWYTQNQPRLQGATIDQVRVPIKAYLMQQRTQTVREEYMKGLRTNAVISVTLDPPRQVIARADRPAKGPAGAAVEMIEFSDFECPFCLNAFPTVKQVMSTYGDRIRLVYRHFPLPNHPRARPAAEAAQCAHEQGKFWEYHDRLFGNQGLLGDDDLKQHAAQLGLDAGQFNGCYESKKYTADIDADMRAGSEAGVSGTPAFFINGRVLTGAQPFEAFKQIIDEELGAAR
jgi:protein-disulfide isomerase